MQIDAFENLRRIIRKETPGWIPFTLDVGGVKGFSDTIMDLFKEKTGENDPAEYFDYDFRVQSVSFEFGEEEPERYHEENIPDKTSFDAWGIGHWAGGARDTYQKIFSPFARNITPEEIYNYPKPKLDTTGITEKIASYHKRGYPVIGYAGSIYEWSWWLRGMENFLGDLLLKPEVAGAILEKVASFTKKLALESARQGIDILSFYDDAGMQTGMQISPDLWRQFVKPAWDDVLSAVRKNHPETMFFFHCCGSIYPILPDLVELGFHILHPIQPETMDPLKVKHDFGNHIVLCGTIGAQKTFPFGTVDDIRQETQHIMDTLGADGRCILCPSNIIQPETPWENILAFAETAQNYRGGKKSGYVFGN